MSTLFTAKARAYVNHGRWVADCPTNCGSACALESNQGMFQCAECHHITSVDWPVNAPDIWEALELRPHKQNRNWFPTNHDLALKAGTPHGQSVAELNDETQEFLGRMQDD